MNLCVIFGYILTIVLVINTSFVTSDGESKSTSPVLYETKTMEVLCNTYNHVEFQFGKGSKGTFVLKATTGQYQPGTDCFIRILPMFPIFGVVINIRNIDLRSDGENGKCLDYVSINSTTLKTAISTGPICQNKGQVINAQIGPSTLEYLEVHFHSDNSSDSTKSKNFEIVFTQHSKYLFYYCDIEEIKCANGNCVWSGLACDGIDNCGDNSDEDNCDKYKPLVNYAEEEQTEVATLTTDSLCKYNNKGEIQFDDPGSPRSAYIIKATTSTDGYTATGPCNIRVRVLNGHITATFRNINLRKYENGSCRDYISISKRQTFSDTPPPSGEQYCDGNGSLAITTNLTFRHEVLFHFYTDTSSLTTIGHNFEIALTAFKYTSGSSCGIVVYNNQNYNTKLKCDNGKCIWNGLACDGFDNCGDNSDELKCGKDKPPTVVLPKRTVSKAPIVGNTHSAEQLCINSNNGNGGGQLIAVGRTSTATLLASTYAEEDLKTLGHCDMFVTTDFPDGVIATITSINLRVNNITGECLDYITFTRQVSVVHVRNRREVEFTKSNETSPKMCQVANKTIITKLGPSERLVVHYYTDQSTEEITAGHNFEIVFTKYKDVYRAVDDFQCDNGYYINKGLRCNNKNNCGDNSDQKICPVPEEPVEPSEGSVFRSVIGVIVGALLVVVLTR